MKCERCGNEAVRQEGHLLADANGPEATTTLHYQGIKGRLVAHACKVCSEKLIKIGWR